MDRSEPYLSVVVTSRNDNHGESLLRRMQTFINALIGQCKRHGLRAELIIVEWNPPTDRPRLAEALRWPEDTGPCDVRIIEVPNKLHARLRHSASLPLFQMIAKNVGIRRARGRFILATNIDILLSDELVLFLAQEGLRSKRMYRIDRWDVMTHVPVDAPVEAQLEYCRTHLLRLNGRRGFIDLSPDGAPIPCPRGDIVANDAGITFGQGWYQVDGARGQRLRWLGPEEAVLTVCPPVGPPQDVCMVMYPPFASSDGRPRELVIRDHRGEVAARGVVSGKQLLRLALPLHPGEPHHLSVQISGSPASFAFDPRVLGAVVLHCGWVPRTQVPFTGQPTRATFNFQAEDYYDLAATDIAPPQAGIRFGAGWYWGEFWDGELFRWARSGAVLQVEAPAGVSRTLRLEVAPGPGIGKPPFQLQVLDQRGKVVAATTIDRRQMIHLPLPVRPGHKQLFRFQVSSGGRRTMEDPRTLDFRAFSCDWAVAGQAVSATSRETAAASVAGYPQGTWSQSVFRWLRHGAHLAIETARRGKRRVGRLLTSSSPSGNGLGGGSTAVAETAPPKTILMTPPDQHDIVRRDNGFWFGEGWGAAEYVEGVRFRWVGEQAWFTAEQPMGPTPALALSLELEPGDGVTQEPFQLELCDEAGNVLASKPVKERQLVHFQLLLQPGDSASFLLRVVDQPGQSMPRCGKRYRVFHCGWSRQDIINPLELHTNACGDFTLLAREDWFDLRAYPELQIFSLHLDSFFCFMAVAHGFPEEVLPDPMRSYHIEHSAGSGWTPEGEDKLMERMAAKKIPVLECAQLLRWATEMRQQNRALIWNDDTWGMRDEQLSETIIGRSGKHHSAAA
jgi:hypothetical protein